MIVVDSSGWIDFLNGRDTPHVRHLRSVLGTDEIILGDLMLCELLEGLGSKRAARELEALLRRFEIVPMARRRDCGRSGPQLPSLRRRGITVRKTIDLLIGTWCSAPLAFDAPVMKILYKGVAPVRSLID